MSNKWRKSNSRGSRPWLSNRRLMRKRRKRCRIGKPKGSRWERICKRGSPWQPRRKEKSMLKYWGCNSKIWRNWLRIRRKTLQMRLINWQWKMSNRGYRSIRVLLRYHLTRLKYRHRNFREKDGAMLLLSQGRSQRLSPLWYKVVIILKYWWAKKIRQNCRNAV